LAQPEDRPDPEHGRLDLASESAVEFLLTFTRAGHHAGYPTADLEERVVAIGDSLGLPGVEISSTPTLVEMSIGSLPRQQSFTLRVRPAAVDLDAIARLDDVVNDVLDGRSTAAEALARLTEIVAQPLRRAHTRRAARTTGA
jgi:uncharacterized membrane protein YjjP (DUF1212 family)